MVNHMTIGDQYAPKLCAHCGAWHVGVCSRIAQIEYNGDGTIKRILYHAAAQLGLTPAQGEALAAAVVAASIDRQWALALLASGFACWLLPTALQLT